MFISNKTYQFLLNSITELQTENAILRARLLELEHPKNSSNSSIVPSKDENRVKKNQSLREKSGRKSGGQKGHKGSMLKMTGYPDEIVKYIPEFCKCCGKNLSGQEEKFIAKRQVIELPEIKIKYIEHQVYGRKCQCGYITEGEFPEDIKTSIQYGNSIGSLASYFYARNYIPFLRMKEFLSDVFHLPISEGGIHYLLEKFTRKSKPFYDLIRNKIEQSTVVGSDETGANLNGKLTWFWTWQNEKLTYIRHSLNRGIKTIKEIFPEGFTHAIINHDRWASQVNTPAKGHQLCTAHLLRDLNYLIELYKSEWATKLKAIISRSIKLKYGLQEVDYLKGIPDRTRIESEFEMLLCEKIPVKHKKVLTLQKKLTKQRNNIFTFLYYPEVPPDNNGYERAIRNIKVKQKISGFFKSGEGAQTFAINRSIIDTIIKSGNNVLAGLNSIAAYIPD